ncbi:uncharacterized protein TA13510 [Theileria annulata]|uniref:Uncharacterized protein n=1 Tax=Theileria annulata TaxID=5874 RepID=Q4UEK2_THEAN|nr:uncharacterized protein TA13510 [Theileria annulata]CAI74487.1 hypothetical protein, conserved [Theileria annulata]|eukprot:XP_952219.1 hypothetical protein, conserved [Theileria annulata]
MGSKCTKLSDKSVSENDPPQNQNEGVEGDESVLEQKSYDFNELDNIQEDDLGSVEENELEEDEAEMKPLESRMSTKNSNVSQDSGLDPGLLPFQNSITTLTNQNTSTFSQKNSSLSLNSQNSGMYGLNTNEEPFNEYELNKNNGSNKSLDAYASTQDSNEFTDPTVVMQTFTPFDMKKTDELASFLVSRCGLGLQKDHNPQNCKICQTVDLSDAPLIA